MLATLQEHLDIVFKKAALSVKPHADGFANAQWTLIVTDRKSNEFVGYLSLLPFEIDESPGRKERLRSLLRGGFRETRYTTDGFPYVLRFSIELPPLYPIGRVVDYCLNAEGWRSRLLPFLKSLAILRDTYCPVSIVDPAPELWFTTDEQ
jgi:hypothetical protein